jgi:type I restriction system adenine methylase HsdM
VLGHDKVRQGFYGQEINLTTYNLCRINMFLHDVNYEKFNIAHGDTLTDPAHWDDEPFEAIVSNPPYSIKWDGDANPLLINDPRFAPAGVLAPKSKADLAFTLHILSWLAVNGTAAIVEFPGVLYRGGAEQKIRQYLIDNNYVDAVIQLPPDLFFGTTIATCIIVLKKSKRDNATLFIDASSRVRAQRQQEQAAARTPAKNPGCLHRSPEHRALRPAGGQRRDCRQRLQHRRVQLRRTGSRQHHRAQCRDRRHRGAASRTAHGH